MKGQQTTGDQKSSHKPLGSGELKMWFEQFNPKTMFKILPHWYYPKPGYIVIIHVIILTII